MRYILNINENKKTFFMAKVDGRKSSNVFKIIFAKFKFNQEKVSDVDIRFVTNTLISLHINIIREWFKNT